jgi:putative transposase
MRFVEAELDDWATKMPNPWRLVKCREEFWGDLSTQGRRLLKFLLEDTMELWRDQWVQADWHKPTEQRQTHRNGYYSRKRWATALGTLHDVRVPRCRQPGLTDHMFSRLEDHRQEFGGCVIEMLLAGVSTRRVGVLLDRIIDLPVSAGQVSQLAKRLDSQVRAFHTRVLGDDYVYVLLDAIYLKARGEPRLLPSGLRRTRKRVILAAYGITASGVRQILDFRVAEGESQAAWSSFLWSLYHRGLTGQNLKLITTDGGGGLTAAVEEVWPCVPRQRCWFHKMQNVSGKVRRKDRQTVLEGLRAVYSAANRKEAQREYILWARKWRELYPKAVLCVERDLPELLAIFDLPPPHRRKLRTTNPIERSFREVRRRTRSIGTFINDASIERIVYGLVAYINSQYSQQICREFRQMRIAA